MAKNLIVAFRINTQKEVERVLMDSSNLNTKFSIQIMTENELESNFFQVASSEMVTLSIAACCRAPE